MESEIFAFSLCEDWLSPSEINCSKFVLWLYFVDAVLSLLMIISFISIPFFNDISLARYGIRLTPHDIFSDESSNMI